MPQFLTNVIHADATNVSLGTTTGTKIGTATSQKLAFYNATPIIQPTGDVLAGLSGLGLISAPTLTPSTATNGESVLGTSYTVTASWGSTGLSVTLPAAGTYLIYMTPRANAYIGAAPTTGMEVQVGLWRSDTGVQITNSTRLTIYYTTIGGSGIQLQSSFVSLFTAPASLTVTLYALAYIYGGGTNWAASIYSAINGWTTLGYVRIA